MSPVPSFEGAFISTFQRDPPMSDELNLLKERADRMGIPYSPKIGAEKLAQKINDALAEDLPETVEEAPVVKAKEETALQRRRRLRKEANKLVRVRITCMNPNKREWKGEFFMFSNSIVGSINKFVPFNAEDGWHVPQSVLGVIRDRECQIFTTVKTSRGVSVRKGRLIKEFAIEELPPLTQKELDELARVQAMSKNGEE